MKFRLDALIAAVMLVLSLAAPVSAQADPAGGDLDGVWRSVGYGYVIEVQGDLLTIYEETAVSCQAWMQLPAAQLGLTVTLEGDRFRATDEIGTHITAERLPGLPELCTGGGTPLTTDPETNFEVFWHTFNEQYAFFELRHVDWQAQYERYRPRVTADTTPGELFTVLVEMITPLEDGHVTLASEADLFSPGLPPAWGATGEALRAVVQREFNLLVGEYLHEDQAFMDEHFIVTGAGITVKSPVIYGELASDVGYISLVSMMPPGEDLASAETAIDAALAALADKEALVIDVRFNSGGLDSVALIFASRFSGEERLAYSKHARVGDSFTPLRDFYVTPGGPQQFTGPIVVLTSGMTASAAEIFVMAMRVLPHVTVIGEPTSGEHSDMLGRTLPNAWEFTLSNEEYVLAGGEVFEGAGIPPDVSIALDPAALANGQDVMLNAALTHLLTD